MLLQPLGNNDPSERFHASAGMAKVLIRAGMAEEVVPEARPWGPMKWTLGADDFGEGAPAIFYNCPNDGCTAKSGRISSSIGKAHLQAVSHCAGTQLPPDEVASKYKDAWARYAKKHSIQEPRKPRYGGVRTI